MVKNFISAKDAKHLAETSDKLLNTAFKCIKDAAVYGHNKVRFDVYEVADVVVYNISTTLSEAGYQVTRMYDEYSDDTLVGLMISW